MNTEELDFYLHLLHSLRSAGGGSPAFIQEIMDKPFREVVSILAPNGIRPEFRAAWHPDLRKKRP